MTRIATATVLSFLIPGAGLWFLGRHRSATVNFLIAVIATGLALLSANEHVYYVFLAVAADSAGYAHSVARAANDAEEG